MKTNIFGKTIIIIGIIVSLAVTGCGSGNTSSDKTTAKSESSTTAEISKEKTKEKNSSVAKNKNAEKKTDKTSATSKVTSTPSTSQSKAKTTATPTVAVTTTPASTTTPSAASQTKSPSGGNESSVAKTEGVAQSEVQSSDDGQQDISPSETQEQEQPQPTAEPSGTATHVHDWQPTYTTVHHNAVTHQEDRGSYQNVLEEEAYDEPIYEFHEFCYGCGLDFTAEGYDYYEMGYHLINCQGSYYGKYTVVGYIHHDAEYKSVWVPDMVTVVDKEAYDEQVVDGYICACGEIK